MDGQQIPSDIDSLDAYLRAHPLPLSDAEAPAALHLTGMRVGGGMSGTTIQAPLPHERMAQLLVLGIAAAQAVANELADATAGRECHAYDECLVHLANAFDHAQAAVRARGGV